MNRREMMAAAVPVVTALIIAVDEFAIRAALRKTAEIREICLLVHRGEMDAGKALDLLNWWDTPIGCEPHPKKRMYWNAIVSGQYDGDSFGGAKAVEADRLWIMGAPDKQVFAASHSFASIMNRRFFWSAKLRARVKDGRA